ncbi:hypothetical protein PAXRUDRAFT_17535 [Paxillus rubicundulus Ve08.2h10]|uniref:Uncharacterized protein n=1 Tax=Paxillus rubicundulus Ve08.2h10 TaxID=930991 RepID=A0A0D0CPW6_9AGAM|nr:hypothetical protein PAXRUDRAFT_17535 [Paxillus rubicundulus Ve08.2h10]
MEAGGSKVEGKQTLDGKQGTEDGEKGKKKKERKKEKEKKEKKTERPAKRSDGGQESGAVGLELGGPIVGGDSGAGTAEETRGRSQERKLKKQSQTQSRSLNPHPHNPSTIPATTASGKPRIAQDGSRRASLPGLGPATSKKAKAPISKSRPKMPSVAQKANFGIDVGVTPSDSIKVYHPLAGPPPQSIPQASAINLIATPVNPLLDP